MLYALAAIFEVALHYVYEMIFVIQQAQRLSVILLEINTYSIKSIKCKKSRHIAIARAGA